MRELLTLFNSEEQGPHLEAYRELQDRWRCLECSTNGFCYRKKNLDTGRVVHINLDSDIMSKWAALMVTGDAVAHCPPGNVEEFDKLVTDAMNSKKKKSSNTGTHAFNSIDGHGGAPQVVYNYNIAPPQQPSPRPETPKAPKATCVSLLSPIHGIEPKDYNTAGLEAFMDYCYKKYDDFEFLDAFHSLQEKRLGIDLLKDIDANILKSECNLSYGTALRIIKCYPAWKESLSINVPTPTTWFYNDETDF